MIPRLADEPTANLDGRTGREVVRKLRGIVTEQQRAAVIVSHDERLKQIADRTLWLGDGESKGRKQQAQA